MPLANFELITELIPLTRRDFPVDDDSILSPNNVRPLVDGEFLQLNSDYKLERGGDNNASTPDEGTNPNVFPVHTERGRYDVQAIRMASVLMLQMYEAQTTIVDTTSLVVGSVLTVQDISLGGIVRRGLALGGSTSGRIVVGYVSRIVGTKVRFIHYANQKVI